MKSAPFVLAALVVVLCGLLPAMADVRIGSPNTGAAQVVLDFHRDTGNYFAAVRWDTGHDITLNLSTDNGATWNETGGFLAIPFPTDIDMVVAGDYVYIALSVDGLGEARLTRFHAATGLPDIGYEPPPVVDVSPATVSDVALASDQDGADNEIYYALISDDGALRFLYDSSADGTTFTDLSPPVANAAGGLDMHFNTNDPEIFLSYVGTDSNAHVWQAYPWGEVFSSGFSGLETRTAISAADNNVVLAHQTILGYGYGLVAWISGDAGDSWTLTYLDAPGTPNDGDCGMVDVTARGSQGFAAIYLQDKTAFDPVFIRRGTPSGWEPRVSINGYDATVTLPINVTRVPPHHYGIAYIGGNGDIPYFDRIDASLFSDGFESGDTSAWSATVP